MIKKVVILAGGLGTRISEETDFKPKPMIAVGDMPILWHIMKLYNHYGINEFIICLGYKGYVIKEFFANYFLHTSNITFDFSDNSRQIHEARSENWKVTLIDTGLQTATGGRLKKIKKFVANQDFCMTYGDGLADLNIKELLSYHQQQQCLATVTAVRPPARFGSTKVADGKVISFQEKPSNEGGYINGGFFVLSPKIFDYITDDQCIWEKDPIEKLVAERNLAAYIHSGFWQPMDTLRDHRQLENLWQSGSAPWKIWNS